MTTKKNEIKLKARSVSRGIAIGKIVCLHGKKRQFYRVNLKKNQIEKELRRFRASIRLARRQLKKLSQSESKAISQTQTNIFEAHLMILEDNSLLTKIENTILEQKINAEWAVKFVTDRYISIYKDIQDEHLRERHIDLQDVTERILTALGGIEKTPYKLEKDSIIVASEVKPSTLIELAKTDLCGIITESGGWTSHTFILAREMRIPAITGIKGILRRVKNGDLAIVDGYHGTVLVNPDEKTVSQYKHEAKRFQKLNSDTLAKSKGTFQTLDGKTITVRANLDIGIGYNQAKKLGAKGIGLFRSEYLFNQFQGIPNEKQQFDAYREIAEYAGEDGVRIRTFDLSLEQMNEDFADVQHNPAMGLRAIRLSLAHEKMFAAQIRALLRASFERNLDIVLPMISDVSEIFRAKEIVEQEKERLKNRKIKIGNPKIGAMIEVPSAVLMIEEIAQEVDFMSVGTNDLVQYTLGVDRDNELVAEWFRTLHPAVLRSLKKVFAASEKYETPTIICGEMAGSPVYSPILIGLGATELSMNVNSMERVQQIISNIALEEAQEIANSLEKCRTANEVEDLVYQFLGTKWKHLFPPELLSQPKKSEKVKK
ncbi:MAG: phosphoenolpyruvate--protein phosphotransferase [Pyrinomonadaceae bacterium]|nr:phosphoenolpyruvate--protein phosphotransferase [Pyrinomonadaceae bacterium]